MAEKYTRRWFAALGRDLIAVKNVGADVALDAQG